MLCVMCVCARTARLCVPVYTLRNNKVNERDRSWAHIHSSGDRSRSNKMVRRSILCYCADCAHWYFARERPTKLKGTIYLNDDSNSFRETLLDFSYAHWIHFLFPFILSPNLLRRNENIQISCEEFDYIWIKNLGNWAEITPRSQNQDTGDWLEILLSKIS